MPRDPIDPRIEYDFFQEPRPVIAWGRFLGYQWQFYARWDSWEFTLSTEPKVYPDGFTYRDMRPEEIPPQIFFREHKYCDHGALLAGDISESEMQLLVRQSVQAFEREHSALENSGDLAGPTA